MSWKSIGRGYTLVAVNLLTLVIILAGLNLIPWLGLKLRPLIDSTVGETSPFLARYGDDVGRAFPGKSMDEIRALARETWSRPFAYDPVAQFKESEHAGRYVNVAEQGYRHGGRSHPWPPPDAGDTVFVFGGSTTFGYGVADAETIAAALERQWRARDGDARVHVYNFGRGFYDSNHELMLFAQLLWRGAVPDTAIFVDGTNEFRTRGEARLLQTDVLAREFGWASSLDAWEPLATAARRMPLARLVDWLGRRFGSDAPGGGRAAVAQTADPDAERRAHTVLDRYAANARMIRALAEEHGVSVRFVWQPIPTYAYDVANHPFGVSEDMHDAAQIQGYRLLDPGQTGGVAAWRGQEIVWCAGLGAGRDDLLYVDAVHYSPKMNALIAGCILDAVPGR